MIHFRSSQPKQESSQSSRLKKPSTCHVSKGERTFRCNSDIIQDRNFNASSFTSPRVDLNTNSPPKQPQRFPSAKTLLSSSSSDLNSMASVASFERKQTTVKEGNSDIVGVAKNTTLRKKPIDDDDFTTNREFIETPLTNRIDPSIDWIHKNSKLPVISPTTRTSTLVLDACPSGYHDQLHDDVAPLQPHRCRSPATTSFMEAISKRLEQTDVGPGSHLIAEYIYSIGDGDFCNRTSFENASQQMIPSQPIIPRPRTLSEEYNFRDISAITLDDALLSSESSIWPMDDSTHSHNHNMRKSIKPNA
jgi:hypothetical protein